MRKLKLLTWHIHGSYLYYLSQIPHDIYLPVKKDRPFSYIGRTAQYPWPENVHEIDADQVKHQDFDCVIYQHPQNYLEHQYEILAPHQLAGPRIYLEHNTPRESPTDSKHWVDDPAVLLVHVTHFNDLVWDTGRTPTRVIDHGVIAPQSVRHTGDIARGAVVVNEIKRRGRKTGYDIFERVRREVPLDLAGISALEVGGIGELSHSELFRFNADRRFFFSPIRYTSLALSTLEAMMVGTPVVGLATTELVTVIQNGVNGYISTSVDELIIHMKRLLRDAEEARYLGEAARETAIRRFGIPRFIADWNAALASVTGFELTDSSSFVPMVAGQADEFRSSEWLSER